MSSRSHHHSSGDFSDKQSTARSTSCSRTTYYDSQYSEKRRNQKKPADRSPASRGYPDECIGNYNNFVHHLTPVKEVR